VFKARVRDDSIGGDNPFTWKDVSTSDLFKGKRVVVFSLPGAFTPTCSSTHLPGYESDYEVAPAPAPAPFPFPLFPSFPASPSFGPGPLPARCPTLLPSNVIVDTARPSRHAAWTRCTAFL